MSTRLICDRCKTTNEDGKRFVSFMPEHRTDLVAIYQLGHVDLCGACWMAFAQRWMKIDP